MKAMRDLVMVALLASGCGGRGAPLTLGAVISQTGGSASPGLDHLQAVELAVDEINAAGGVLDRPLALVNVDDHGDPTQGPQAAMSLIGVDHVPAIIGAITSPITLAIEPVTTAAKVVLISGSSTSPSLTGRSPYLWRTCASDALQGQLLANRAIAHGRIKTAVTYVPGPYGMGLADVFTTHYQALGGTIPFNQMFTPGQSSYASLLDQIYATKPDSVLLVAYIVDGAQIVRDYNTVYAARQSFWFFTDSLQYSSFVQGVGGGNFTFSHEGTAAATPSGPAYASFASAFQARSGKLPEGRSAQYYDATYLVALAIQQAGKADGPSIRDNLRLVADPPGIVIGPGQWALARSQMAQKQKINYEGASGSVDLDGNGDVIAPYDIWNVTNGQITITEHAVSP
jgi:branched-chain amino acid transport system substrate-binding protein